MQGRSMVGTCYVYCTIIILLYTGSSKIAVISGVGTRQYYRKLGYKLDGPYMSKSLVEQ